MSTSVEVLGSREEPWTAPAELPLNQAAWQAWVAKGRAQEQRNSVARTKAVRWISAAALLAAAVLWSHLAPFDVVVRFIVTGGAMVLMFQASHNRNYAFASIFGALALIYNPVLPAFGFSGGWQRAVVVASAVPFIASIAWRNAGTERHD